MRFGLPQVAAGADVFGAQSCAVTSSGDLYCWGVGVACAARTTAPRLAPTKVEELKTPALLDDDEANDEKPRRVASVAAGGSFCLALDDRGDVWAWGLYVRPRGIFL